MIPGKGKCAATPYTATAPPRYEGRLLVGSVGFSHPLHHRTEDGTNINPESPQRREIFGKIHFSELSELPVSDSPLLALPPGSQPQCNLNQG
jgi:hypothetical protein